jgi:hypothetical protein
METSCYLLLKALFPLATRSTYFLKYRTEVVMHVVAGDVSFCKSDRQASRGTLLNNSSLQHNLALHWMHVKCESQ